MCPLDCSLSFATALIVRAGSKEFFAAAVTGAFAFAVKSASTSSAFLNPKKMQHRLSRVLDQFPIEPVGGVANQLDRDLVGRAGDAFAGGGLKYQAIWP